MKIEKMKTIKVYSQCAGGAVPIRKLTLLSVSAGDPNSSIES